MNDRLMRRLVLVSLSMSLVSLVLAAYALHLQSRSSDELHELSESLRRAVEVRPVHAAPLSPPPPALDDGVDELGAGSDGP